LTIGSGPTIIPLTLGSFDHTFNKMASDQQLTLVPTDLLTSILSSIDKRNQSVSRLENENKSLRNELSTLQANFVVIFTFLPKIAPELRR
jgi:hypothetical protein